MVHFVYALVLTPFERDLLKNQAWVLASSVFTRIYQF